MWLIVGHLEDPSLWWAAAALTGRGLDPVELVDARSLASASWEHRVDGRDARTVVVLPDGRRLDSEHISGVVNRLVEPPVFQLERIASSDRDYVAQELHALTLSWLRAFACPVLNPPSGAALAGPWFHRSQWHALAAEAGLPTTTYAQTSLDGEDPPEPGPRRALILLGSAVIGLPVATETIDAARRLRRCVGAELLGITLSADPYSGQWVFAEASPVPDLRPGGEVLADLLVEALHP